MFANGHASATESAPTFLQGLEHDFDISEHLNMDMFANIDDDGQGTGLDDDSSLSSGNSPNYSIKPEPVAMSGLSPPSHMSSMDFSQYEFGRERLFTEVIAPSLNASTADLDPKIIRQQKGMKYELQIDDIPAKSRVETQIKVMMNFYPPPEETAVHLPAACISKPKLQLKEPFKPNSSTLLLDTVVVCDTDQQRHANMCSGCIKRERKRAFRKKIRLPVEEEHWNENSAKRVIVFNCKEVIQFGDYVDMTVDGQKVRGRQLALPIRLACYCRHHNEKIGFRAFFVLKDASGNVVAHGSTSPVMITDDHKTIAPKDPEITQPLAKKRKNSESSAGESSSNHYSRVPYVSSYEDFGHRSRASVSSSGVLSPPFSSASTAATSPQTVSDKSGIDVQGFRTDINSDLPTISRIIPAQGPVRGGIEVTLLGSGFCQGLSAKFGDLHSAATHCWNSSTMVALLPAAPSPGPVVVSFDGWAMPESQVFTYVDDSDRQLIELALQLVGLKMSGKLEDARDIARRIIGSGTNINGEQLQQKLNGGGNNGGASDDLEVLLLKLVEFMDIEEMGEYLPDYNFQNRQGQTMMHLSAALGYEDLCDALVDRGADVHIRDSNGMTPLHMACLYGRLEVVELLVEDASELYDEREDGTSAVDLIADADKREIIVAKYADSESDSEQTTMGRIANYFRNTHWQRIIPGYPSPTRRRHVIEEPPAYEEIFPEGTSSSIDYSNSVIEETQPRGEKSQISHVASLEPEATASEEEEEESTLKTLNKNRKELSSDRMLFFFWLPLLIFTLVWLSTKLVIYMNDIDEKTLQQQSLALLKRIFMIDTSSPRNTMPQPQCLTPQSHQPLQCESN